MPDQVRFTGEPESARGGGHVVAVDPALAASIGAKGRTRVRGTFGGAPYRSNLVSTGGRLLLGVHKATVEASVWHPATSVDVTMEPDPEPREDEIVPEDLAAALDRSKVAAAAWETLAPSHCREHIRSILDAKTRRHEPVEWRRPSVRWVARTDPGKHRSGQIKRPIGEETPEADFPWIVIVWNDPINLMSYVTFVFQKLFGYRMRRPRS